MPPRHHPLCTSELKRVVERKRGWRTAESQRSSAEAKLTMQEVARRPLLVVLALCWSEGRSQHSWLEATMEHPLCTIVLCLVVFGLSLFFFTRLHAFSSSQIVFFPSPYTCQLWTLAFICLSSSLPLSFFRSECSWFCLRYSLYQRAIAKPEVLVPSGSSVLCTLLVCISPASGVHCSRLLGYHVSSVIYSFSSFG